MKELCDRDLFIILDSVARMWILMGEKIMNLEAKNTLQTAISDAGYWRWWNQIEDNCQIEFGGVLLLEIILL